MCNKKERTTCKEPAEIKEFMKRKFIVTLENFSTFNLHDYTKDKIKRESHIVYHPMNSVMRLEGANIVKVGIVDMQDAYV